MNIFWRSETSRSILRRGANRSSTRWMASAFRWRREKRWALWENPAAGNPAVPGRSSACMIPLRDRSSWTVTISRTCMQKQLKPYRRKMQMIFQDPYASLNARMTVRDIIAEPLIAHGVVSSKEQANDIVYPMLERVGLTKEHANRYAHEFSGGQRQRVGIARALVLEPQLVICDEPISALDVSIQAQVINLLKDFQEEKKVSYLFIAHDLSMVRYVSDDVGVMYLGQMVELCEADEIYAHPLHPYTKGLLGSIPIANPRLARQKEKSSIEGDIPSPINPPAGCRFHTRCPYAKPECAQEKPQMKDVGGGHMVACHLF